MKRIVLLALATATAAACGGSSSGGAVDRNRAGTGTSTLKVTATATVTSSTTAPLTNLSVTLDNGQNQNVSNATVTINNAGLGGDVALTESPAGSGIYTSSKTMLPSGDFTLNVVSGTDAVHGVVLGSPGAHTVNAPTMNTTVTANQPLDVSWTTPSTAKAATVSTRDLAAVSMPDTGAYTIAAANNPPRTGQRVTVSRMNETDIAGGLPGSLFSVTVTNQVTPYTVQ
jgi:hypothetical protein